MISKQKAEALADGLADHLLEVLASGEVPANVLDIIRKLITDYETMNAKSSGRKAALSDAMEKHKFPFGEPSADLKVVSNA